MINPKKNYWEKKYPTHFNGSKKKLVFIWHKKVKITIVTYLGLLFCTSMVWVGEFEPWISLLEISKCVNQLNFKALGDIFRP